MYGYGLTGTNNIPLGPRRKRRNSNEDDYSQSSRALSPPVKAEYRPVKSEYDHQPALPVSASNGASGNDEGKIWLTLTVCSLTGSFFFRCCGVRRVWICWAWLGVVELLGSIQDLLVAFPRNLLLTWLINEHRYCWSLPAHFWLLRVYQTLSYLLLITNLWHSIFLPF